MQTILVIGGAGFIGRHLTAHLAGAGHAVFGTHRTGKKPTLIAGVHWLATDLSEAHPTAGWPAHCDTVVYLAQARDWRNFPEAAREVFEVNVRGLMQAASYAQQAQVQRFIYASTGSIYTDKLRPALETDACAVLEPRSFYVACKLAGEILLGPYQSLFPVINLRLFMPYGAGQSQDMLMPRLVSMVRAGQPIQLHGQDGLLANPTAVGDVAETIARCLELNQSTTLNVGGPQQLSLRVIGNTIGKVVEREPAFAVEQGAPGPVLVGDTALLGQTLGWQPATRLEDGLRQWLGQPGRHAALSA